MRQHQETLLKKAVQAIQSAEPNREQLSASAIRIANRLGIDDPACEAIVAIENCSDVQHQLTSYRAGTLPSARSLVIEAHLRDCGECRRRFRSGSGAAVLDWSAPQRTRFFVWHPRTLGWSLACSLALLVVSLFLYKAYWQVPPGVRAEVQSIDGSAYRISGAGDRSLSPGDKIFEGEHLRTGGGAHAILRIADGSTIEVGERSLLGVGARGRGMTVTLDNGALIVQASKRTSGNLYVRTPDCRVAVTGTVFSVNSGIKGSRIAVLEGAVRVMHAGMDTMIQAGDQVTTNDNLSPEPVEQQIAWSHDLDKYLPLLAQFSALQRRVEQIPLPPLRYSSDLLQRVPTDTQLYISIPNLGDFLSQASQIFDDQLKQSPVLQQWWNSGHHQNTADLDALIDKIHRTSQYLGNEIVIVGVQQAKNPAFAVVADLKQGGFADFVNKQFPASNAAGLTLLDQTSLNAAQESPQAKGHGYALIRTNEAVFSNSIATLKEMNTQLNASSSGFATGDFGQQITAAYSRGAGVILAADLQRMMSNTAHRSRAARKTSKALENSGLGGLRYLIAEHREMNGQPENRMSLQFSGARQGVASWLAAPAPIGSLDFVTPNAAVAVALLTKDPKAIADDILAMTAANGSQANWTAAEDKLQINLRDDLAATLGGDFLFSLDGPVLPTPSWKAVIEVSDSQHLELTLERIAAAARSLGQSAHSVAIESSDVNGQRFYSVHDQTSGNVVAHYAFANGYMVLAPKRALVMEALRTQASGNSLARSAAFRALLPKDANENYSAVAYQNLTPVLTPLLSQFTGESAEALRQLAADARPTIICARGEESRIDAASDSHLFGFDFLTLGALINSRNKSAGVSVSE
jgi:hypothetical protein